MSLAASEIAPFIDKSLGTVYMMPEAALVGGRIKLRCEHILEVSESEFSCTRSNAMLYISFNLEPSKPPTTYITF